MMNSVKDFERRLAATLQRSAAAQKIVDVDYKELPQTPEDWIDLQDLHLVHKIVDTIEENISQFPQISTVGMVCTEEGATAVVFELMNGETICIDAEDIVLAFSPSH